MSNFYISFLIDPDVSMITMDMQPKMTPLQGSHPHTQTIMQQPSPEDAKKKRKCPANLPNKKNNKM